MSMMEQEQDPRGMAILQQLMGGAGGGMPGGAGPEQAMAGGGDDLSQDEEEHVRAALDSIGAALGLPSVSERERMILEQASSILQKLLAQREGEMEQAMGGGGAMRVLQRQGMRG